jgi:hypothetical protein
MANFIFQQKNRTWKFCNEETYNLMLSQGKEVRKKIKGSKDWIYEDQSKQTGLTIWLT